MASPLFPLIKERPQRKYPLRFSLLFESKIITEKIDEPKAYGDWAGKRSNPRRRTRSRHRGRFLRDRGSVRNTWQPALLRHYVVRRAGILHRMRAVHHNDGKKERSIKVK